MRLYSENEQYKLYQGNMLDILEVIEPNSIDSIVTDPPYELNFMGKGWDNAGISFKSDTWQKCYEVLKPGGYLLAFGGSRTFHRIACAIEDAGFEIRDTIMWLYGSGFPKSMNIGLAIDKKNGVESPVINIGKSGVSSRAYQSEETTTAGEYNVKEAQNKWKGWGSALKPSYEPIIVARKPFKGSLVDNVIQYGVGGINVDECRVPAKQGEYDIRHYTNEDCFQNTKPKESKFQVKPQPDGRFPANTILTYDDSDFDEVCGRFPNTKGEIGRAGRKNGGNYNASSYKVGVVTDYGLKDSGSASRYFMNCKYNRRDEDIWNNIFVNNVASNLEIGNINKEFIAQNNVEDLLLKLKNHYAKYVENQQNLEEIFIVQDIVEILTWDSKIETSQVIQDFIGNYNKCIQFLNLVQFVEKMDSIDTTQTTQNLLKLFGYVKVVITNYIQGNLKFEQKRYLYAPKASKRDRDEGLDTFSQEKVNDGRNTPIDNAFQRGETLRKNTHPTVKPTDLMQYLVRLVTPNGGTILDPFNGSGSTGKAVMYENKDRKKNYKYIGIELTEEYLPISKARIEYVCSLKEEKEDKMQVSFDELLEQEEIWKTK